MIHRSERPVLYVGGGVIRAGASDALREFAELANLPAVTTLMARGAIPDSHPLTLGMPGMHGMYTAITAMQRADLLIAIGARFDDRVTGDPSTFAPLAKVIHVDVDPAEIGKVRDPEVPIVGDAAAVLEQLLLAMRKKLDGSARTAAHRVVRHAAPVAGRPSAALRPGAGRPDPAAVRDRGAPSPHRRRRHRRGRRRPAPDVGIAVLGLRAPQHVDQLGRARHHGVRRAGGHRRQRWRCQTRRCSPSTATAASR